MLKPKVFIIGVLVLLVFGLAVLVAVLPRKSGQGGDEGTPGGRLPTIPSNVFVPAGPPLSTKIPEGAVEPKPGDDNSLGLDSSGEPTGNEKLKLNLPTAPISPPGTSLGATTSFTDLSELQNLIQPPALVPPRQNEILAMPAVAETELAIDPNGTGGFSEYMDKFVEKALNISFSYERFNSVSKAAGQTILNLESLIEKALKENNFSKYRESFLVMKEFSEYKIGSLKAIPVKSLSEAATLNQRAIGFEELLITLAEKAVELADNKISRAEFEAYYTKHNNTALYHNQQLRQQYLSFFNKDKKADFWLDLAKLLGVGKVAEAFALLPFGGQVLVDVPCICSFGLHIRVGPPAGGAFFISGFSSRIFSYFTPFPIAWVIGNYTATPVPCLQPVPFGCAPIPGADSQGVVFLIGTGPP